MSMIDALRELEGLLRKYGQPYLANAVTLALDYALAGDERLVDHVGDVAVEQIDLRGHHPVLGVVRLQRLGVVQFEAVERDLRVVIA